MTGGNFDLDAYCRRIGFTGRRTPTLATLRAIHLLHPMAIPFENLDVLLRRGVQLDLASVQNKLVGAGRGGYCYEHNLLLSHALTALGFTVTHLTARVRYNVPAHVVMPLTHMLLKVDIDDEAWIADVGFGGNTLTAPLRLADTEEQATPYGPFRLIPAGERYLAQAKIRDAWAPMYQFGLDAQSEADLEVGNWYTATSPKSPFYARLVAARVLPEGRAALRDNRLALHRLDGTTEHVVLQTESELRDALTGLGLTLPDDPGLGAVLTKTLVGAV